MLGDLYGDIKANMMNNILFFDTETTSLIPKGLHYREDYESFPHLVQIAWDLNGKEKEFIIKPEGYEIPEDVSEIHGITQEKALKDGSPFKEAMELFIMDAFMADEIVAHNIYFDISIVKANCFRNKFAIHDEKSEDTMNYALDKYKRIDTARKTIKICGLKQKGSNRPKFPTLSELYMHLFGETFPAHNALHDIRALKRCYYKLKEIDVL